MRRETLATADEREREINHAFLPHLQYSMEQYVPYYVGSYAGLYDPIFDNHSQFCKTHLQQGLPSSPTWYTSHKVRLVQR